MNVLIGAGKMEGDFFDHVAKHVYFSSVFSLCVCIVLCVTSMITFMGLLNSGDKRSAFVFLFCVVLFWLCCICRLFVRSKQLKENSKENSKENAKENAKADP